MENFKIMKENKWKYLLDDYIISLLVGDTPVVEDNMFPKTSKYSTFINIQMPKINERQITDLSKKIGVHIKNGVNSSQELSQLIKFCCTDEQKMRKIMKYIFGKENFKDLYDSPYVSSLDEFKKIRSEICNEVIKDINNVLYFHNCKVELEVDGPDLITIDENWIDELILNIPDLENIDEFQISGSYTKINEDINKGDFTGAMIQSRTLLEGALKYAISVQNKHLTGKEDLPELIKLFKQLYLKNNVTNSELRSNLKRLYGNLSGAIEAIGILRNKFGDAHATNASDVLSKANIHFIVNASFSLCSFVLETCKK
ncbi:hypothetical protein FC57_GL001708 [Lactobacillus ultunensis DSM 16047]|uniref:Abortive infection protein-like C-terminal domain-containing protein n=2 Tax=Lactobacillus ultunensis TaxID=227945 RepID=C2EPN5_9LACO|nr:hypothetical protein HMPREF0548_1631 [Lactobacillus ultunensis DSM 16047]KRL79930.1 hypothetical protein FC57_GL001708 [Lactobacillus ultunensis DSM 16047]